MSREGDCVSCGVCVSGEGGLCVWAGVGGWGDGMGVGVGAVSCGGLYGGVYTSSYFHFLTSNHSSVFVYILLKNPYNALLLF